MDDEDQLPDTGRGFQVGGSTDDLFQGAAWYYRRFRRLYPECVTQRMIEKFGLDGTGRLLDVGCGTGQVFQGLADQFSEVIAIDADAEMVAEARTAVAEQELVNVDVRLLRAEELSSALGSFRMATFGASFHWMDRAAVANSVYDLLKPGGSLVALAYTDIHEQKTEWEAIVCDTLHAWLGPRRRAGGGVFQAGERHEAVLEKTRFGHAEVEHLYVDEAWPTEQILGFLYSTSYASKAVLGDNAEAFEQDLRNRLKALQSDGQFRKLAEYSIISATK